jgi:hypothetical protein
MFSILISSVCGKEQERVNFLRRLALDFEATPLFALLR